MSLEVAARTGPHSDVVGSAEDYRQDGDLANALKIYDQLALETNLDELTRRFVQERQYSLNTEQHLQQGDWVPFLPTDNRFIGWQTNFGVFTVQPDGALEVSSDENGHMIYSRARIGPDFEVRGAFEVVSTSDQSFQAGLVMGVPQFETYNWYAFRIKRNDNDGDVASFSQQWSRRQVMVHLRNLDDRTNSFDFRFQRGLASATVNGQQVLTDSPPPRYSYVTTNEFMVGLGAFNDTDSTVIRYHDVQIRSLANQGATP